MKGGDESEEVGGEEGRRRGGGEVEEIKDVTPTRATLRVGYQLRSSESGKRTPAARKEVPCFRMRRSGRRVSAVQRNCW